MFLPALLIAALLLPALPAHAEGMFELSGKPLDLAQAVLDFLFKGKTEFFDNEAARELHNALRAIFGYYSGAVMVVAVFIVIYHMIVMVGETAHYGVPMGKRDKQMWMPVRLVLALGLLVPIGGFNSAQFLMMQMARWGSSLASNAWDTFANTGQIRKLTLHGSALVDPTATIANLVAIGICAKSYELVDSTLSADKLQAVVVKDNFFRIKEEKGQPVSRTLYQTYLGATPAIPVDCGSVTWLERPAALENTAIGKLSGLFSRAHLESIHAVEERAFDLGGRLALGSLGVYVSAPVGVVEAFAGLVGDYRTHFVAALQTGGVDVNRRYGFSVVSQDEVTLPGTYGWLAAGATFQKFALTDTGLMTPELAAPVVSFTYPSHAGASDRATAQIARALSFTRLLLARYDSNEAASIWFNPDIDHGKGPFKQALALTAAVLAHDAQEDGSRQILDSGIDAEKTGNPGVFQPIAMGFRSLDLADRFLAAAEWSPRASGSTFGPALLFADMAKAVAEAFYAISSRSDAMQLPLPPVIDHIDRPADFARYLLVAIAAALLIPGLLLVFVLPLIPLVKFAIGGVIWLIAIVQGLAAAPIWAMTFLSLRGDDLMPQTSRLGLALIFNIFLRPILMIVGFIAAIMLMHVGFGVLQTALQIFSYDGLQSSHSLYSLGSLALLIANLTLSFGLANASMKCIDLLPEMTLRWLGSGALGTGAGGEEGAGASQAGASGTAAATAAAAESGANGNGTGAGGASGGAGGGGEAGGGQQLWQRKLLSVLENLAGQSDRSSGKTGQLNPSMFPQMPDKADLLTTNKPPSLGTASIVTVGTGKPGNDGKAAQPGAQPGAMRHLGHTDRREPTAKLPAETIIEPKGPEDKS
ncbi:MAG: DotA/TraY family protein [Alphaproteobacteria bacterium]